MAHRIKIEFGYVLANGRWQQTGSPRYTSVDRDFDRVVEQVRSGIDDDGNPVALEPQAKEVRVKELERDDWEYARVLREETIPVDRSADYYLIEEPWLATVLDGKSYLVYIACNDEGGIALEEIGLFSRRDGTWSGEIHGIEASFEDDDVTAGLGKLIPGSSFSVIGEGDTTVDELTAVRHLAL